VGQRSCSCAGSNENCMFCYGTGFVGHGAKLEASTPELSTSSKSISPRHGYYLRSINPLAAVPRVGGHAEPNLYPDGNPFAKQNSMANEPVSKTALRLPGPSQRTPQDIQPLLSLDLTVRHSSSRRRNREVCRFCFRLIQLDGGLEKHLMKCGCIPRALEPSQYQYTEIRTDGNTNRKSKVAGTCFKCGQDFRFQLDLRGHLNSGRCPGVLSKAYPMPQVTLSASVLRAKPVAKRRLAKLPPQQLLQCPHCKSKVKATRLKRHVKRVHGKDTPTAIVPQLRPKAGSNFGSGATASLPGRVLPPDHASDDVFEQTVGSDRRDSTRGIGHVVRESGRYGSYPIHDGFDDESGPD